MLFLTGSTYGQERFLSRLWKEPFSLESSNLSKDDYVVILGNFGFVLRQPESRREEEMLDQLESLPFTTLFIDGNHENFNRLLKYPEADMFGGKVGVIRPHVLHLKERGRIYDLDGFKCWCFGGANTYSSLPRDPGKNWWPEEEPTGAEYGLGWAELEKYGWCVDYILTHEMPFMIYKWLYHKHGFCSNYFLMRDPVQAYFQEVAQNAQFKRWFTGSYHMDVDISVYGRLVKGTTEPSPKVFSSVADRVKACDFTGSDASAAYKQVQDGLWVREFVDEQKRT